MKNKRLYIIIIFVFAFFIFSVNAKAYTITDRRNCKPGEIVQEDLCKGSWSITSGGSHANMIPSSNQFQCVSPGIAVFKCENKKKWYEFWAEDEIIEFTIHVEDTSSSSNSNSSSNNSSSSSSSSNTSSDNKTTKEETTNNETSTGKVVENTPTVREERNVLTGVGGSSNTSNGGSNSSSNNNSNSQNVSTSDGIVNGQTCNSFKVCRNSAYGVNGVVTPPEYNIGQNDVYYTVTDDCNTGINYTSFCIDPGYNAASKNCTQYSANPIDINTKYGRRAYLLYKAYMSGQQRTGDEKRDTMFYQAAARYLMYIDGSDYKGYRTDKAGNKSLARKWASLDTDVTTFGSAPLSFAQSIASQADSGATIQSSTLGLTISRLGKAQYENGRYVGKYTVTVENYKNSGITISASNISFNKAFIGWENGGAYTEEGNNISFVAKLETSSNPESNCDTDMVEATLKYNNPNDLRNAYIIAPIGDTTKQNYLVFSSGNTEITVKNSVNLNSGTNCEEGCTPYVSLECGPEDGTFAVVNEGAESNGGSTDWENCIMGKKDPNGNSYDIINESENEKTEDTGEDTDNIEGFTDDNSGGGSDPHVIADTKYCVISCKEKYAFLLPGKKDAVKAGTYFSFSVDGSTHSVVGISAERTCVSSGTNTSSEMGTETFNNRVKSLRRQQIDFLNLYLYYKQLYNAMYTKNVAELYRNSKKDKACSDMDHSKTTSTHNVVKDKYESCDDAVTDTYGANEKDSKYIPSSADSGVFGEGDAKVEVKYYTIDNDSVDEFALREQTVEVRIDQSFKDAKIPLAIKGTTTFGDAYSFYSKYYPDVNVFDNHASINQVGKTENLTYTHSYCSSDSEDTDKDGKGLGTYSCTGWTDEDDSDGKLKVALGSYAWPWDEAIDASTVDSHDMYKEYRATMDQLNEWAEMAREKYNALQDQITVQTQEMGMCTNYLDSFGAGDSSSYPYRFNPDVTFEYKEDNYMAQLAPNKLVNINNDNYQPNITLYYCDSNVSPNGVFSCAQSAESVDFKFGNEFGGTDKKYGQSTSDAKENIPDQVKSPEAFIENADTATYYNVARVGSRATFGRYSANNSHQECSSSYVDGGGSKDSYCYEFFRSSKAFYTLSNDGLATTDPSQVENKLKSIIDTDGYVYPVSIKTAPATYEYTVTFANIGQYGESKALGRIMGSGGYLAGDTKDAEVCTYKVTPVDEDDEDDYCIYDGVTYRWTNETDCPRNKYSSWSECKKQRCPDGNTTEDDYCIYDGVTYRWTNETDCPRDKYSSWSECKKERCPDSSDSSCAPVVKNYCKEGSYHGLSDADYKTCLVELMKKGKTCCDEINKARAARDPQPYTEWGTLVPPYIEEDYMKYCSNKGVCQGFQIISTDTTFDYTESLNDSSKVVNSGLMQFNARTISLNNIFPNGNTAVNWKNSEAKTAISTIESLGDGIFGGEPDYSVVMDTKCITAIKEYNSKHQDQGGFNDYTNLVNGEVDASAKAQKEANGEKVGSVVLMSDEFKKVLKNCNYKGKDTPDKINDSSKVRS